MSNEDGKQFLKNHILLQQDRGNTIFLDYLSSVCYLTPSKVYYKSSVKKKEKQDQEVLLVNYRSLLNKPDAEYKMVKITAS